MKIETYNDINETKKKIDQRNFILISALIVIIFVLALRILLVSDKTRTVIVPAGFTKSFWVDEDKVSEGYLVEMGAYFAQLMYNVTPASTTSRHNTLLKYVNSEMYSAFEKELAANDNVIRQTNIATYFTPISIGANTENQTAKLTGVFIATQGDKVVQRQEREVLIQFKYDGNKVVVSKFKDTMGADFQKSIVVDPNTSTVIDPVTGVKTTKKINSSEVVDGNVAAGK